MSATITLTMTNGPLSGKRFVFPKPTLCTIGRSADCEVRIPDVPGFEDISRHHCLLDIEPPSVCVSDTGSLNGTFVNGLNIGKRAARRAPDFFPLLNTAEHPLKDGDEIRVGHLVFRVGVDGSTLTPSAASDMPENRRIEAEAAREWGLCGAFPSC
jgi:pSer/pThr/pTyr-binding forkhead associated (FHA) protein